MTNFEMVERLRAKANVSYEEAKAALENANWDLLDAMVLLEKQGKVEPEAATSSSYSTREERAEQDKENAKNFKSFMGRLGEKIVAGVNYLVRNSFEVSRKDKVIVTLPALVLLICLLPWFWPVLILLIIGLFTGFRYAFRGPDLEKKPINDAINKAADVAENIKSEVKGDMRKDKEEEADDNDNG